MAFHRTCDGLARRDLLKVGVLGSTGLTLSSYLQMVSAGEQRPGKATSAIFINLQGGASHLDTFDMKPEAPAEIRGEFKPISTNVPGIEISEHLPKLAQCADQFALLRGVTHSIAAHPLGQTYINTGNRPLASLEYPALGAVVSKELPAPTDLPAYVAVPNTNQRPGFLGVKYAPLQTGGTPRPGQPFRVRGISLFEGQAVAEIERRTDLLKDLDTAFKGFEADHDLLDGLDQFGQQAHTMITSQRARDAFDVSRESPQFARQFGSTPFGMSCLLSIRLVEAGVRFVTLSLGGWDTHQDNFNRLSDRLLPPLDEGLSALLTGLKERGLLESTTVYVTGEFGRTPRINGQAGRDHFPRNMFMLLAGGGIRGGQVIGESDENGTLPIGKGFSPEDVTATFYQTLGIDHTHEYHTNTGRPIMIVRDGRIIHELFA